LLIFLIFNSNMPGHFVALCLLASLAATLAAPAASIDDATQGPAGNPAPKPAPSSAESPAPSPSGNPAPSPGANPPPSPKECNKDGKTAKAGETFESGDFWYNCSRSGEARYAGCVVTGKRLNDGDTYEKDSVLYECTIDSATHGVRAVACVQHTKEGTTINRRLGCNWVEGPGGPIQYEWNCKYDASAQTATAVATRCQYVVGDGAYQIEVGQCRSIQNSTYTCVSQGSTLNLQQGSAGAGGSCP